MRLRDLRGNQSTGWWTALSSLLAPFDVVENDMSQANTNQSEVLPDPAVEAELTSGVDALHARLAQHRDAGRSPLLRRFAIECAAATGHKWVWLEPIRIVAEWGDDEILGWMRSHWASALVGNATRGMSQAPWQACARSAQAHAAFPVPFDAAESSSREARESRAWRPRPDGTIVREGCRALKTLKEQCELLDRLEQEPDPLPRRSEELRGAFRACLFVTRATSIADAQKACPLDLAALLKTIRVSERQELVNALRDVIYHTPLDTGALLCMLGAETDPGVISSAAINVAVLTRSRKQPASELERRTQEQMRQLNIPDEDAGELPGPTLLAAEWEHAAPESPLRLGILMGMVLLGDKRIWPLVEGKWEGIAKANWEALAKATNGEVCTLQVEFLLEWLGSVIDDDNQLGSIAANIAKQVWQSRSGRVLEVSRRFPHQLFSQKPAITVVQSWTFPEYAEVIAPRLQELIDLESEPKVTPLILEGWVNASVTATDLRVDAYAADFRHRGIIPQKG